MADHKTHSGSQPVASHGTNSPDLAHSTVTTHHSTTTASTHHSAAAGRRPITPGSGGTSNVNAIYQAIKNLEQQLINDVNAAPRVFVDMGTFHPSKNNWNDRFDGVRSQWARDANGFWQDSNNPVAVLYAVNVTLRFSTDTLGVDNRFWVRTSRGQVFSAPGQKSLEIDVGADTVVLWQIGIITGGSPTEQVYLDTLFIRHVGFGAFTVPALPVAIIYAPPQVGPSRNVCTLTETDWVGTSITTELETGTLRRTTTFSDAGAFGGLFGDLAAAAPIPEVQAVVSVIRQVEATVVSAAPFVSEQVQASVQGNSLETVYTKSVTTSTQATLGMGEGDVFVYLLNARMVWAEVDGQLSLTLLGCDTVLPTAVKSLREDITALNGNPQLTTGPVSRLPKRSILELLALDPVAWRPMPVQTNQTGANRPQLVDPKAPPNLNDPRWQGRYNPGEVINVQPNVTQTVAVGVKVEQTATRAQYTTSTSLVDSSLAISFFNKLFGGGSTTEVFAFVTFRSSAARTAGRAVTYSFTYDNNDRPYQVQAFVDALFGTLAFQIV